MLPRYTLKQNKFKGGWALTNQDGETVATFATKAEAMDDRALEKAIGRKGGTVKIHLASGRIEEERTYPRVRDPRWSPS